MVSITILVHTGPTQGECAHRTTNEGHSGRV